MNYSAFVYSSYPEARKCEAWRTTDVFGNNLHGPGERASWSDFIPSELARQTASRASTRFCDQSLWYTWKRSLEKSMNINSSDTGRCVCENIFDTNQNHNISSCMCAQYFSFMINLPTLICKKKMCSFFYFHFCHLTLVDDMKHFSVANTLSCFLC